MANDEMPRYQKIAAKAVELQRVLGEWAHEAKILEPGERIVFSFGVEGTPTGLSDDAVNVWEMPAAEFFSRERLTRKGVSGPRARRIENALRYGFRWSAENSPTMASFLSKYNKTDIRQRPNVGPTCVGEIARMISEAGLTLRE